MMQYFISKVAYALFVAAHQIATDAHTATLLLIIVMVLA